MCMFGLEFLDLAKKYQRIPFQAISTVDVAIKSRISRLHYFSNSPELSRILPINILAGKPHIPKLCANCLNPKLGLHA